MQKSLLILLGGGIGSLCRYWMSMTIFYLLGRAFPYGTLAVNVLGSFLMGLLAIILVERFQAHTEYLRLFLLMGILGGFTTFSAFSIETFYFLEAGEMGKAIAYILASVFFCLIAVSAGALVGKQF